MTARRARLSLDAYEAGVTSGDRAVLSRAITLVESRVADDAALAQGLLARLLPLTGRALRVGVTGVPGVGKSTFIDALGAMLVERGHRVAVLAVDPSSALSGGSILGDKTRMERLSTMPGAYIRPTPSGLTAGGVARRTREAMLLCEAAGFDVVLVETVGVGQGETAVADMVDFFLVLALPGSGDELQGIKKGTFELADAIAVNKCDGDGEARARVAMGDLRAALRYLPKKRPSWSTQVLAVSGHTGARLAELWAVIERHREALERSGELASLRAEQQRSWMWALIRERLEERFRADASVAGRVAEVERAVLTGAVTPSAAAEELLRAYGA